MRIYILLFLAFTITSCATNQSKDIPSNPVDSTVVKHNSTQHPFQLIVEDSSLVSAIFLRELRQANGYGMTTIKINKEYLTLDNKDTAEIPHDYLLHKNYFFSTSIDSLDELITMNIEFETITMLRYHFQHSKNNKIIDHFEGVANYPSSFFLGAETASDNITGEDICVNKYYGIAMPYSTTLCFAIDSKNEKIVSFNYKPAPAVDTFTYKKRYESPWMNLEKIKNIL